MLCKLECEGMKQPGCVGGWMGMVGGDDWWDDGYHVCHKESSSLEVIWN